MALREDKYGEEDENLTQVRGIIKRLNEEKPSKESNREVVVRADGSKVIRVTKKRKVLVSAKEKNRRGRRHFVYVLAGGFVVMVLLMVLLFIRMASMSSSAYLEDCQNKLQQSWGASSIQIEGAGVDGTSFHLSNVAVEFPESCMIERVELGGIEANLDWLSFFRNCIQGEQLKIARARIVLREKARMNMPMCQGAPMWKFQRVECKKLTVQFADELEGPMMIRDAEAYMYYPHASNASSVVILSSGLLHIKGWKTVNITESKAYLSSGGVDEFSLRGTTDGTLDVAEQRRTSIAFSGSIKQNADFTGPYVVCPENMSFSDFTRGRFEEFFTARTYSGNQRTSGIATIVLAGTQPEPVFNGEFQLRNICLSSYPALMAVTEHIEPAKRRFYNPISLHRGFVKLETHEDTISIEMPDNSMEERDLVMLKGKISLDAENVLSGELHYGIPMLLARVEYPDGRPDPIFQQQGDWAVLRTHLRGRGNLPDDDMSEVEARAVIARRDRPARIPFTQFDINKLADSLSEPRKESGLFPESTDEGDKQNPFSKDESLRNPFESADDPFKSTVPF